MSDLICIQCNKNYRLPPSKAKNSKFCSKECKANSKKVKKVNCTCKVCNTNFENKIEKEYCSRSCYIKDVKNKRVQLVCQNCGEAFEKAENKVTKYCGKSCQIFAQSSGLAELPSNGRKGFRRDLPPQYFFKSSLEADYARYCEATGKPYVYEYKTFKVSYGGKEKVYTPDFYHPDEDRYVELKAIRRDRKFNSNLLAADILKSEGVNIDVMLMHEFYNKIKQSKHYWTIDNIENKNYLGTKHLIYLKKKV
jgi:hypothetical protein